MSRLLPDYRGLKPILCGFLFISTITGAESAFAQAPDAKKPNLVERISDFSLTDQQLTMRARAALRNDPQFAKLDLRVWVRDKVATLEGTVTKAEIAKQAEATLKKVPGLATVINDTKVVTSPDPLIAEVDEVVARLQAGESLRQEPDNPLTTTVAKATASSQSDKRPLTDSFPLPPIPSEGKPVVPTIQPGEIPPPPAPSTAFNTTLTARPMTETVAVQIDKVRRADPRFAKVTLEETNGVVRVQGIVKAHSDAWELARRLADVPGVQQVLVGQVKTQ